MPFRRFESTAPLLILLTTLAGCQPSSDKTAVSASATSAQENWLVIRSEPEALEQAREQARQAELGSYEQIFKRLHQPGYLDLELLALLDRHRADAVKRLSTIIAAPDLTEEVIGAALILARLHEPACRPVLIKVLRSSEADQRLRLLNDLGIGSSDEIAFRQFIIDEPALVEALLMQLDDRDTEIVSAAIQTCGYMNIPGASARFLDLLDRPDIPDRKRIMFWLSKGELNERLFRFAAAQQTALKPGDDLSLFEAFARTTDQTQSQQARAILMRHLELWADDGEMGYRGDRLSALAEASETATAEDLPSVRAMVQREQGMYADAPLRAWIRLEPAAGRQTLLQWMSEPARRRSAINVAGQAFAGQPDQALADALKTAAQSAKERELASICRALRAIGGETAIKYLVELVPRLSETDQARFRTILNPFSTSDLMQAVEQSAVLPQEPLQRAKAELNKPHQGTDQEAVELLDVFLAAGSATMFDVETGFLPCRHDRLLGEFARISRGIFAPDAAHEIWHRKNEDDDDADYTVQFVQNARLYQGRIRNFADWYDVERLTQMANTAISDSGVPERFVALASDDQIATIIFADPARLFPLAEKFHMPLSRDAAEAMKNGRAFEQAVFEQLKAKE